MSGGIPAQDLHFATFQPTFRYELIWGFGGVVSGFVTTWETRAPSALTATGAVPRLSRSPASVN